MSKLVAVEWEDIVAYDRTTLPENFDDVRLFKITCGLLWLEHPDYIVVVSDYDLTYKGRDYRHNDFTLIPRGVIRKITAHDL